MTYGLLTFDDFVGLVPALGIVGTCLYGFIYGFVGCVSLFFRKFRASKIESKPKNATLNSAQKATASFEFRSILFLICLAYLLSPLSTMIHLKGKRYNANFVDHQTGGSGLFDLIHGTDPRLQVLIGKMPNLLRGPRPPLLFSNRHLQFIPWLLQNAIHRHRTIPYQRIEVPVWACLDKSQGTENCIRSSQMNDTITLDIFPPFDDFDNEYPEFHDGSPIIFFSPGLRCNSQDLPGTMIVRRAFGEGFRSVVIHRRGHTPAKKLQAPRWNLFGDVDDLEQVYWFVQEELAAPHTPFFLHGISSGTATVVSALAEFDRRHSLFEQQSFGTNRTKPVRLAPSFVGSVAVTPGYDISKVFLPERFKFPYNPLLVNSVKDHFIRQNEEVLRSYNSQAVDAALRATNLQDFLNAAAPFAGYPNATEYYKGENPVNGVTYVTTPTMILNSFDDPCCNIHNLYEQSQFPDHNGRTYAQMVSESPRGLVAVSKTGTHCPFLDSSNYLLPAFMRDPYSGDWMLDTWGDRVSIEFYKAALQVFKERRFNQ